MKAPARLWLWLGGGLLVLVVITAVLQAVNNLIWQLSYLLPAWLVGPFTLLLFGGATLLMARVAWPWLEAWRRNRADVCDVAAQPMANGSIVPLVTLGCENALNATLRKQLQPPRSSP